MDNHGRKSMMLKLILSELHEQNLINRDLVDGVEDWRIACGKGDLKANASTKEEAIFRTELLMKGLENPKELARRCVEGDHANPNSEVGLRARLSDEMALCLRRGGVILPDGKVEKDVASAVVTVMYELKPELRTETSTDLSEPGRVL
jgi:hypothetical protein